MVIINAAWARESKIAKEREIRNAGVPQEGQHEGKEGRKRKKERGKGYRVERVRVLSDSGRVPVRLFESNRLKSS